MRVVMAVVVVDRQTFAIHKTLCLQPVVGVVSHLSGGDEGKRP